MGSASHIKSTDSLLFRFFGSRDDLRKLFGFETERVVVIHFRSIFYSHSPPPSLRDSEGIVFGASEQPAASVHMLLIFVS